MATTSSLYAGGVTQLKNICFTGAVGQSEKKTLKKPKNQNTMPGVELATSDSQGIELNRSYY